MFKVGIYWITGYQKFISPTKSWIWLLFNLFFFALSYIQCNLQYGLLDLTSKFRMFLKKSLIFCSVVNFQNKGLTFKIRFPLYTLSSSFEIWCIHVLGGLHTWLVDLRGEGIQHCDWWRAERSTFGPSH